jgi:hypothetical protein
LGKNSCSSTRHGAPSSSLNDQCPVYNDQCPVLLQRTGHSPVTNSVSASASFGNRNSAFGIFSPSSCYSDKQSLSRRWGAGHWSLTTGHCGIPCHILSPILTATRRPNQRVGIHKLSRKLCRKLCRPVPRSLSRSTKFPTKFPTKTP